jgi:hypothetical protein
MTAPHVVSIGTGQLLICIRLFAVLSRARRAIVARLFGATGWIFALVIT